ncbi:hypothetical protein JCGZ_21811 [Jatropha curcas]|uniref:Uncharacterized protein n=1 Tax=Jatropha curcas TaxID=180498 RepID=A0A067JMV3_JATCU|nr:hypothetical protein JCGZ_21811 [Jatropha curcas]
MRSSTRKLLSLNAIKMSILILLLIFILNFNQMVTARTLHHSNKQTLAANEKKVVAVPDKAPPQNSGPNPCTYLPVTDPKHCGH